jgi:hypothetical protein
MSEERRETYHAPTVENTRPSLHLPLCNFPIGFTTTLLGTITMFVGGIAWSVISQVIHS